MFLPFFSRTHSFRNQKVVPPQQQEQQQQRRQFYDLSAFAAGKKRGGSEEETVIHLAPGEAGGGGGETHKRCHGRLAQEEKKKAEKGVCAFIMAVSSGAPSLSLSTSEAWDVRKVQLRRPFSSSSYIPNIFPRGIKREEEEILCLMKSNFIAESSAAIKE